MTFILSDLRFSIHAALLISTSLTQQDQVSAPLRGSENEESRAQEVGNFLCRQQQRNFQSSVHANCQVTQFSSLLPSVQIKIGKKQVKVVHSQLVNKTTKASLTERTEKLPTDQDKSMYEASTIYQRDTYLMVGPTFFLTGTQAVTSKQPQTLPKLHQEGSNLRLHRTISFSSSYSLFSVLFVLM